MSARRCSMTHVVAVLATHVKGSRSPELSAVGSGLALPTPPEELVGVASGVPPTDSLAASALTEGSAETDGALVVDGDADDDGDADAVGADGEPDGAGVVEESSLPESDPSVSSSAEGSSSGSLLSTRAVAV